MASDTEESSAAESQANDETRVLKMLYKGNMEELSKSEEQMRKGKIFNRPKHDYYKQTRCTSTAQEEQSALPVGVINRHEDSSEDEDCYGEGRRWSKKHRSSVPPHIGSIKVVGIQQASGAQCHRLQDER